MSFEKNNKIVILGAGLSGLCAAGRLRCDYEIFEKEERPGGLCRSRVLDGFTFDIAGHLFHFKERKNLALLTDLLGSNIVEKKRSSWIWSHERFIPYPFQSNFQKLPAAAAFECLEGLRKARQNKKRSPGTNGSCFKSWILETYGQGIANHFMFPYNEKFWKFPLERMDHSWAEKWIPLPSQDKASRAQGYNAVFWYPRSGGMQALTDVLISRAKQVHTRHAAVRLDLKKKEIFFANGHKIRFHKLVTSIPLPEWQDILTPLPHRVRAAFAKLKYTSLFNVNLGLRVKSPSSKHWIYSGQKDISFYRWGIASNFSRSLAPQGCSSLYFEISYIRECLLDKRGIVERILADCRKTGLNIREDDICAVDTNDVKYAYCLYDDQRRGALSVILPFLEKHGIYSIGRYGGWKYASMEDVITEARSLADVLNGQGGAGR
jgi:protoporphyrinogen oxidase